MSDSVALLDASALVAMVFQETGDRQWTDLTLENMTIRLFR